MSKLLSMNVLADDGRPVDGEYDHTKANAINTCPVWGLVRFEHHKVMRKAARQLPLEAGKAAHDGFAAVRLMQLWHKQEKFNLAMHHGIRIFGADKWDRIISAWQPDRTFINNVTNVGINAVIESGYFDDPMDRRRTVDNICELIMNYVREWDFERWPVWIRDENDPTSDVGIEIPFSFIVELHCEEIDGRRNIHTIRYTGKIDGIHIDPKSNNAITTHENKTGSRLDDAWLSQWIMSHQITGYAIACSTFTNSVCLDALVLGSQLPVPKNASEGQRNVRVSRTPQKITDWALWLLHVHELALAHRHSPLEAPRYTHSCNRYFRPCSFIALCDNPIDEQRRIFAEMEEDKWSPLEEEVE